MHDELTPEERIAELERELAASREVQDLCMRTLHRVTIERDQYKEENGRLKAECIKAVEEEREACAKICDAKVEELGGVKYVLGITVEGWTVFHLANRIRNRGKEQT